MPSYLEKIKSLGVPIGTIKSDSFRVPAIHRGSQDFNIIVSQVDGRAYDFARGSSYSFVELVELLTGKKIDDSNIEGVNFIKDPLPDVSYKKATITLLPQYEYWVNRGISTDVLRITKGGLCHGGIFYRYFVFPIFTKSGRICGYSGRDTTGNKSKKWLHDGKSSSFLYGPYLDPIVSETVEKSNTLYITESIGDCLSLWEKGIWNATPSFGLNLSDTLVTYLFGQGCNVVIALNNDPNQSGNFAATKMAAKLATHISLEKINIRLSMAGRDYNDMLMGGENLRSWLEEFDSIKDILKLKLKTSKLNDKIKFTTSERALLERLA